MLNGAFSQSPGRDQVLMPLETHDVSEMACTEEESSEMWSVTSASLRGEGGFSQQDFFEAGACWARLPPWLSFRAPGNDSGGDGTAASASCEAFSSPSRSCDSERMRGKRRGGEKREQEK